MPFSSVLGASSVIKPGVCTSTTRPTVPYEGQLIYETDTDRVASYNGSAWVYTATGGLVLLKAETSFSAVSSVTCDNIFSSAYTNYRIMVRYTTGGSGIELRFRLRTGGTSASGSNYSYQQIIFDNTTSYSGRGASQTTFVFSGQSNGDYKSAAYMDIFSPFVAEPTNMIVVNTPSQGSYAVPQAGINGGNHSLSTSYDGFEILTTSSNTTGSYTVYGYAK